MKVWFSTWFPACLMVTSVVAAVFPVNSVFVGAAGIGSAVALVAIYALIYGVKQFRISWILADGLLLGYSLGTFNTALKLTLEGGTAAIQFARPQEQLSLALAASLLASAVLFFAGAVAEKPIPIDTERLKRSDLRFVLLGLIVVTAAFMTGGMGYMGTVADEQHHVSMLGEVAGVWGGALPALTVFLFPRCTRGLSRIACWILLSATIICLIPQGRRAMLYSALLALVAFGVSSAGRRISFWKHLLVLAAALPLLYAGNVIFYAMRVSSWQAGSGRLSLTELSTRAVDILKGGRDASFDQQVEENLRDRTFVLGYLADLLEANWSHEALYGRDLLFSLKMAVPSTLYENKDSVTAIGMEENLVNPEFGLFPKDEANSILTTGVSDFGIVGVFVYPVVLSLLISLFTRRLAHHFSGIANVAIILTVLGVMWKTEISLSAYVILCRDLIMISLPLAVFKIWGRTVNGRAAARVRTSPWNAELFQPMSQRGEDAL